MEEKNQESGKEVKKCWDKGMFTAGTRQDYDLYASYWRNFSYLMQRFCNCKMSPCGNCNPAVTCIRCSRPYTGVVVIAHATVADHIDVVVIWKIEKKLNVKILQSDQDFYNKSLLDFMALIRLIEPLCWNQEYAFYNIFTFRTSIKLDCIIK